jgi:hypothetical protein
MCRAGTTRTGSAGGTELRSFAEQISVFRGTAETMSISSWEGATSRGPAAIEKLLLFPFPVLSTAAKTRTATGERNW